jgi:nucleotide-binding universal stress UspA family protein
MATIVVAIDGSASALRAVEHAALVAKRASADVWALNVQLPIRVGALENDADRSAIASRLRAHGETLLEPAAALLRERGVAVQTRVLIGDIAESIVGTADELGAEQIVMGSRGMSALPGLLLGSNATKVIHLAKVPVTIVK